MTESIRNTILVTLYNNQSIERFDLSDYIEKHINKPEIEIKGVLKDLQSKKQIYLHGDIWRIASTSVGVRSDFSNTRIFGRILDEGILEAQEILINWGRDDKLNSILKFLSSQHELHPNVGSFKSNEIREKVFRDLLPIKEVDYLCRHLVNEGDVLDGISKDGVEIGFLPSTDDALYSSKYLPGSDLKPKKIQMSKNYDLEIREAFDKKYLKVFLKDLSKINDIASILRGLSSVQRVNLSEASGKEKQNLTVYPTRVYDIEETRQEVDFTLKNYFDGGTLDPVFNKETISNLSDKAYMQIIDLILNIGKNLEKFERLYKDFDEENFRDFFLPYLNTVSKNHTTTGETFNKKGKTDILIQDNEGVNVFIAECKIWNGAEELKKAVTQLLFRYVTWRDEKVALIIFNKDNKRFTELIQKAIDALKDHELFDSYLGKRTDTSYSFLFRHPDDPEKKIRLELVLFNCIQS